MNSDFHGRILSIEGKNGFEVYLQIAQTIDAVPDSAGFVMNAELLQLATLHGPKVRDLRSRYGFRLLLKKQNAEYKHIVGENPKDEQSKPILWNVLDPVSKRLAATDKIADMDYNAMKSGSTCGTISRTGTSSTSCSRKTIPWA